MGFLNINLDRLRESDKTSPLFASKLPEPPPPENTKSGDITVRIGSQLLSGSIDPKAEAEKFAGSLSEQLTSGGAEKVIVYGLGLGYHLEALFNKYTFMKSLVVIEANMEIVSAAFSHRDLTSLLADSRFSLVAGPDEAVLMKRLGKLTGDDSGWEIAIHLPSYRCIPKRFARIESALESLLGEKRYKARFSGLEKSNIMANINAISKSPEALESLERLFKKVDGEVSAILVGAGPSLDRNLPFLESAQERCFILAVDTSADYLLKHGIRFDAVISVDPQPLSGSHFHENRLQQDAPLIFTPTTQPQVVAQYAENRLLLVKKRHSIFGPAESLVASGRSVDAGGSVSCFGLELLAMAGADRLGFTGVDFAYPKGIPYNRGSVEELAEWAPVMHDDGVGAQNVTDLHPKISTTLYSGAEGITHRHLDGYRKTFEEIIKRHPGKKFFNLNSTGARIEGCQNLISPGEAIRIFGGGNSEMPTLTIKPETENPELEEKLTKTLFG
jgi:hypothetical protein